MTDRGRRSKEENCVHTVHVGHNIEQATGTPRQRSERLKRPYLTPAIGAIVDTSPKKIPTLQIVTHRAPNLRDTLF